MAVISPHYDDAVFSCGALLSSVPGSMVLTVCTGQPENASVLTDWDRRCGFSSAGEALTARAQENEVAMQIIEASSIALNFLAGQYGAAPRHAHELLGDAVRATLTQLQPAAVFFPLGLSQEDHILTSDAMLTLCHHFPAIGWYAYADIRHDTDMTRLQERLQQLADKAVHPTPFHPECIPGRKHQAASAYQSQFRGLGPGMANKRLQCEELYWRLQSNMELI